MTTTHPLAAEYLRDLQRCARTMPKEARDDLIAEIRSHLDTALGPDASEAEVRNVLDDLGPPSAIVAATRPPGAPGAATRRGLREGFAIAFLLTGFPPILGWLVGAVLLLVSPLWTARQKLLGLLVWPGGLMTAGLSLSLVAVSAGPGECIGQVGPSGVPIGCPDASGGGTNWPGIVGMIVVIVLPILVAAYLWRAAGRAERDAIAG
ncbi:MAG: hypothetical protein QOE93_2152 [Actinomycetota bacterium]|nr:hypothetical protein [Actinomycetota bacterium]